MLGALFPSLASSDKVYISVFTPQNGARLLTDAVTDHARLRHRLPSRPSDHDHRPLRYLMLWLVSVPKFNFRGLQTNRQLFIKQTKLGTQLSSDFFLNCMVVLFHHFTTVVFLETVAFRGLWFGF